MKKSNGSISDDLIEWLNQPDVKINIPEKFSCRALYWAEKELGGAAWDSICELQKLIKKLPGSKKEEFQKHLKIISSSLFYELNEYKKLHSTKSKRESPPEPMYSVEYQGQAINIFNLHPSSMSKNSRAESTINKLKLPGEDSRATSKPSAKTILNWVKAKTK
jgi:hypothetical protein